MFRGGYYVLHLCLQEGCVGDLLVIKKKRWISVWVSKMPRGCCDNENCSKL